MPGGNTRLTVFREPYPVYAERGNGSRVVDVDGIERIDFVNNYTALVHGHAHPRIVEAATRAVERGSCFGFPTELEIDLAEALIARGASFEQVRFTNSGTEAVMLAVKAARAFTGRPKIAKCEGAYHGSYDLVEASVEPPDSLWGTAEEPVAVPSAAGTPASVTEAVVVIPFNDPETTSRILAAHADELAAVIIDPLPNRVGLIPASTDFLGTVQRFCNANGVVLISDEIISFRLNYAGAQAEFGYEADLTTLGKLIGGGFPVGAVAGRRDIMAVFDPRGSGPLVPHAGTFNANPVSMAAGLATLALLTPGAIAELNALGEACRSQIGHAITKADLPWQVSGAGSLFRIHPTREKLSDYRSARKTADAAHRLAAVTTGLLDLGVFMDRGGFGCTSTAMRDDDIAHLGWALSRLLPSVREPGTGA